MNGAIFIIIFQVPSSVLTKGILRGGGDTKFLVFADVFCFMAIINTTWYVSKDLCLNFHQLLYIFA